MRPSAPGRRKLHKARISKFDRILERAPVMFTAAQLRVWLRALVTIDPYTFDDVVEHLAANQENNEQTSEEILLSTIDGLPDDKLTRFALRLVLTAHTPIPREGELDLLTEAEAAFAPQQPKKTATKRTRPTQPLRRPQRKKARRQQPKPQRESAKGSRSFTKGDDQCCSLTTNSRFPSG
jgi:ParB family transcriptional regulator, chromosome partitioning protein